MSAIPVASETAPIYVGKGLTKSYGPIVACDNVDIDIRPGELTAIVGDNGAGKTTLVKMLTGAIRPDRGTFELRGEPIELRHPLDARVRGIEAVYQELALAPNLDCVANVFMGRELTSNVFRIPKFRRLDSKRMRSAALTELERLGIRGEKLVGTPVGQLSGGQRQVVAIARARFWTNDVLFMDEPTAALGVRESAAVIEAVKGVVESGTAVVMVSHVLAHVLELAHHVVVMRHGQKVADNRGEPPIFTMDEMVRLIIGV
jgi:fructose transport system ATP-binding protein